MARHHFEIQTTWDGDPLPPSDWARVELVLDLSPGAHDPFRIHVDAPYRADPPPAAPSATRCPGLWNFEVAELFLLGSEERYLEIELGPHGHWLALAFAGERCLVEDMIPVDYRAEIDRGAHRWRGEASLSSDALPAGLQSGNAYTIHGPAEARAYHACFPLTGSEPNFHQLSAYRPLRSIEIA